MIRTLGFCFGMILSFSSIADRLIVLKDGSRIRGEILSVENGLYKILTRSMGTIQLENSQILEILSTSTPTPTPTSTSSSTVTPPGAVTSIQSTIMNNPGIMSTIMELQNDPQMKAVLSDPEVMRAIQNFDFQALADNPKIKALMNNSKIKSIHRSVQ